MAMYIDRYYEQQVAIYSHLIFKKVDTGIYEIIKDKQGNFTGRCYADKKDVLDSLDTGLKVMLIKGNKPDDCYINFEFDYK